MSKHIRNLRDLPPEIQDWHQRDPAYRRNYRALIRRDAERRHATLKTTSPAAEQDAVGHHPGDAA